MVTRARWHRLALLLALTGCATGSDCGTGCVSLLTVALPPGVTSAQACVEGVCTSEVVGGALLVPLGRDAEGTTAAVTVTVAGTAYEGEVPLERTRPNSANCAPVCVNGQAELDLEAGRVTAPAG